MTASGALAPTGATPAAAEHGGPAIEARSLARTFGSRRAVDGVSLVLHPGECLALFGPNGAGKTTLLRMLAGLLRPTAGSATILGAARVGTPEARASIGVISHASMLYGALTARENVEFAARLHGVRDPAAAAASALERMQIANRADVPVRALSRGLQQRVSIARATVHEPSVVLLDEPFSGLDEQGASALAALLGELRSRGAALVLVTHNLTEGLSLATHVAVMRSGRLVRHERRDALHPATFAAEYREGSGENGGEGDGASDCVPARVAAHAAAHAAARAPASPAHPAGPRTNERVIPPSPAPDASAPALIAAARLIAHKDLAIEFRTRTAFFSALVFALLAITIFYFAWDPTAVAPADLAPGVLWVIFTFSGLLGLQRSFGVEQADRAMDALLAAPAPREAIYLGKMLANLLFVAGVQVVAIPAVALFYNMPVGGSAGALAAVALLAAVGLVAVGTLFSAMAVNTRLAELLLPVLSLPFFVPVVMPAAQTTARLLAGRPVAESMGWLKLLTAFDLVFVTACMLIFPYTLDE